MPSGQIGMATPRSTILVGNSNRVTIEAAIVTHKGRTKLVLPEKVSNDVQKDLKPPRVRAIDQRISPFQMRKSASEKYEEPASSREGWWRSTVKDTPNPGSYESAHFLEDFLRKPRTYSFKSDGRRLDPTPQIGCGKALLPGAYEHQDFLQRFDKFNNTYGFKATKRQDDQDLLNVGKKDKDVNVCPTAYGTEKYCAIAVDKQPSRHWQFKSQSRRFPTIYFQPKEGPAPGKYDYNAPPPEKPVRSAFLSKTPRFSSSHTKVPGPGAYERTFQSPMPKTIMKMGKKHGLFFSSAIKA